MENTLSSSPQIRKSILIHKTKQKIAKDYKNFSVFILIIIVNFFIKEKLFYRELTRENHLELL